MKNFIEFAKKQMSFIIAVAFIFNVLAMIPLQNKVDVNSQQSQSFLDSEPAKMSDYWDGQAEWKLHNHFDMIDPSSWRDSNSPNTGSRIEQGNSTAQTGIASRVTKIGNTLYWFHRIVYSDLPQIPGQDHLCADGTIRMSTGIRTSTDNGITWSKTYEMESITDANSNQTWGCEFTDGGFYYDEEIDRWFHISQCRRAEPSWRGCLATRDGSNPIGKWTWADDYVITSQQLAGMICDDDNLKCDDDNEWGDEGTYDIIDKIDGYYYLSFHLFKRGFGVRGVVKTTDFYNYEYVDSPVHGVLDDAVMYYQEQINWREEWKYETGNQVYPGPVGFGTSTSFVEDGQIYTLVEGFDKNLQCQSGQNWDFGLFRTDDLAKRNWEQLPAGNPILYSDDLLNFLCTLQYPELYVGTDGYIYLMYNYLKSNNVDDVTILRLEKKKNILKNGDFWKCELVDWNNPQGNYGLMVDTVIDASDRNCRLDLDCNRLACPSELITQKINYNGILNDSLYFSLNYKSDKGSEFEASVLQYDANNVIIDQSGYSFSGGDDYSNFQNQVNLKNNTAQVEVVIKPISGRSFVDEVELIPNSDDVNFVNDNLNNQLCNKTEITEGDTFDCSWSIDVSSIDSQNIEVRLGGSDSSQCDIETSYLNYDMLSYGYSNNEFSQSSQKSILTNANDYLSQFSTVVDYIDYDNDSIDEILWYDNDSFKFYLTEVVDDEIISIIEINQTFNEDWYVSGAGNLSGDADKDIVLHNKVDGRIIYHSISPATGQIFNSGAVRFVDGSNYSLGFGESGSGWRLAGIFDYNNDGQDDMVLQNGGSSAPVIFFMNGEQISGGVPISGLPSDYSNNSWKISDLGNIGGSNISGILFDVDSGNYSDKVYVGVNSSHIVQSIDNIEASNEYRSIQILNNEIKYENSSRQNRIICDNISSDNADIGNNTLTMSFNGVDFYDTEVVLQVLEVQLPSIQIKVLLEGALVDSNREYAQNMRNDVSRFNPNLNNDFVDEVFLELVEDSTSEKLYYNNYYIDSEGNLIDQNTLSNIFSFPQNIINKNYKINIKHRNHIGFGSIDTFFGNTNYAIDFSDGNNVIGGSLVEVGAGRFAMPMGNINSDSVRNALDRNLSISSQTLFNIYNNRDINMDGVVNSTDRNLAIDNPTAIEYLN